MGLLSSRDFTRCIGPCTLVLVCLVTNCSSVNKYSGNIETLESTGIVVGMKASDAIARIEKAGLEFLPSGTLLMEYNDDYLQHRYPLADKEPRERLTGDLLPQTVEIIRKIGRVEPPTIPAKTRVKDFEPVELVYNWEAAINEARRCLRCGMGAEILFQDKCATCLTCLRVCPYHVPHLDDSGTIQIPPEQCQACGICVTECPANAIVLRKPYDRRQITEELEHILKSAEQAKVKPLVIGFCCQYGLFGTSALASLWREARAGIWIVPVLCAAKVEVDHILHAFEMGAEGVFIAGCGEQCARENTAFWVQQHVDKVRKTLMQIGLEPERVEAFILPTDEDVAQKLDRFAEQIGNFYLASVIIGEVKS